MLPATGPGLSLQPPISHDIMSGGVSGVAPARPSPHNAVSMTASAEPFHDAVGQTTGVRRAAIRMA